MTNTYRISARIVVFSKIGEVNASTQEEALNVAYDELDTELFICHSCGEDVYDHELDCLLAEELEEGLYEITSRTIVFKRVGEYEGDTEAQAIEVASDKGDTELHLCNYCSQNTGDSELEMLLAEDV